MVVKPYTMAMSIIFTTIEVRFDQSGSYTAIGREGWIVTDYPDKAVQIETFKRGYHRVKLAVYGSYVDNIGEWGAWLCSTLIDRDERVWRHIDIAVLDV